MTYQIRPARRSEAKPLIGLYAESGAGKTYSALLLARGFVGETGRVLMIETESGRGEAFSDPAEYPEIGGYDVISLRENFSPRAYGEAITAAEHAGVDALIIDSASHEWEGAGGVLDMASQEQQKGKKGVLVWQQPKMEHQRHFMLRFMQTPVPLVILCMRAKYPMKEVPSQKGGKEWVRADQLEPKQADDILFEMFVHGWISRSTHVLNVTKCTAKGLEPVFAGNRPISIETGRQLAAWAAGNPADAAASANGHAAPGSTPTPTDELLRVAEDVAALGTARLEQHWTQALDKPARRALAGHIRRLKAIAAAADAADDVGFDDDAGEDGAGAAAVANGEAVAGPAAPGEASADPAAPESAVMVGGVDASASSSAAPAATPPPGGSLPLNHPDAPPTPWAFVSIPDGEEYSYGTADAAQQAFTGAIANVDTEHAAVLWTDNAAFLMRLGNLPGGPKRVLDLREIYEGAHGAWPPQLEV